MRNFALILLFLFLSIVSSCAKIDNVEKNFPKDSHKQILEITGDFQGS